MKLLGNILWFILVGLWSCIGWVISGLLCCVTVIGIPFGMQCFKIARLSLFPFGKEIEPGKGTGSAIGNIIWVILLGLWLAIGYIFSAILFCITVIGIPFGKQCFKLAKLSFMPFGAKIS
jgi:uncharacterized membrane protein YccF (DUF307 family)